eukprot:jgi/Botrbrau1/22117/Bobra.0206s0041.1
MFFFGEPMRSLDSAHAQPGLSSSSKQQCVPREGRIVLQDAQICSIICKVRPELLRALHKRPRDLEELHPNRLPHCRCEGGVKLRDACYAPEFLPHIVEAAIDLPPSDAITTRPLRAEECTGAPCLVPRPVPLEVALAHMPMLRGLRLLRQYRLPPSLIPYITSVTSLELQKNISHDELAALASVRSIKYVRLTIIREDVDHSARQVQIVCSGAVSHLRSLSVDTRDRWIREFETVCPKLRIRFSARRRSQGVPQGRRGCSVTVLYEY